MDRVRLENKVMQIIADLVSMSVRDIKTDSGFIKDLHFDSLDAVELIMAVEDEFEVSIPDADAERLINVKLMVDYIEKKIKD